MIVGGVGYPDLCDYSIGIEIQERLSNWEAPPTVSVEDLSYNPIAVCQRLDDEAPAERFTRMVIVSAVCRGTRPAGSVHCYRWDRRLPSDEEVQDAVTDAVTGIIALENTLVIIGYFGALPAETIVVEIEPEAHEFGATLSDAVREVFDSVCERIKLFATDDESVARLPIEPLTFSVPPGMRVL